MSCWLLGEFLPPPRPLSDRRHSNVAMHLVPSRWLLVIMPLLLVASSCLPRLENKEDLSETWGHKDLTVVGKALSKRAARRLDQIWRRNEAQIALARTFRGCRVRWRLRAARQRACAHLVEHARARAWATLLRRCAVERQRPPAARLVVSLVRRFAAQRRVWAARRRKEAIGIQRLWRGWLGRRRASLARQDRAATRLQRWWRSSKLLRMLRAKRRVLCWWRHVQARRSRAARSIQAATRGFLGTRLVSAGCRTWECQ